MSDHYMRSLQSLVYTTIWEIDRLLFRSRMPIDALLVVIYSSLIDWDERARRNQATYIQGFMLWQHALDEIDAYSAAHGGGEVAA